MVDDLEKRQKALETKMTADASIAAPMNLRSTERQKL